MTIHLYEALPAIWRDYLSARGVKPEVAAARGYRFVCSGKADGSGQFAADYGFPKNVGGLLIPLHPLSGGESYQLRVDDHLATLDSKGKRKKFLSPKGQSPVLDVNPIVWGEKRDNATLLYENVLFIVEGTTRADALASIGVPSVAIQGVNSWRSTKSGALPDLADLPLRGKRAALFTDGDVETSRTVNQAAQVFGDFLYRHGADNVRVSTLPTDDGLDDWIARMLAEGHSEEAVRGMLAGLTQPYASMKQQRQFAKEAAEKDNRPFLETADRDWSTDENLASMVLRHHSSDMMIVYQEGKNDAHGHTIYWLGEDGVWDAEPASLRKAISSVCGGAIAESFIREDAPAKELHKLLTRVRSSAGQLAIIAAMPGTAARLVPEVPFLHRTELNRVSDYIGLRNGVWNLRTLKRVSKDEARTALITSRLSVTYDPGAAGHASVEKMLESYGEGRELLLAHLGRALYRQPGEHFLLIHGEADSGKSTLVTTLSSMMGEWCQPMMADALTQSRDSRAHNSNMSPLFKSAIAICEEVGGKSFGNTLREGAVLKDVTGGAGTTMHFSEKGVAGLKMPIIATIIMTGNSIPTIGLNDTAMAKRLRLFHTTKHDNVEPSVRQNLLVAEGPAQRYLFRLMMEQAKECPPGSVLTDDRNARPQWMLDLVNVASAGEKTEFQEWAHIAIVADSGIDANARTLRLQVSEVWDAWCAHNNAAGEPSNIPEMNGVKRDKVTKLLKALGIVPNQPINVKNGFSQKIGKGWYGYRLLRPEEWPDEYESPEREADTTAEADAGAEVERVRREQEDARVNEVEPLPPEEDDSWMN